MRTTFPAPAETLDPDDFFTQPPPPPYAQEPPQADTVISVTETDDEPVATASPLTNKPENAPISPPIMHAGDISLTESDSEYPIRLNSDTGVGSGFKSEGVNGISHQTTHMPIPTAKASPSSPFRNHNIPRVSPGKRPSRKPLQDIGQTSDQTTKPHASPQGFSSVTETVGRKRARSEEEFATRPRPAIESVKRPRVAETSEENYERQLLKVLIDSNKAIVAQMKQDSEERRAFERALIAEIRDIRLSAAGIGNGLAAWRTSYIMRDCHPPKSR